MNQQNEVLVIGSGGVWSKGPTLDAAYAQAARRGSLGKQVVIVVAPTSAGLWVDDFGSVRWDGERRHEYVRPATPQGAHPALAWSNRRTAAMRLAVEAAFVALAPVEAGASGAEGGVQ
jgi:hypothetical protein